MFPEFRKRGMSSGFQFHLEIMPAMELGQRLAFKNSCRAAFVIVAGFCF
jgi:hypothetical protein